MNKVLFLLIFLIGKYSNAQLSVIGQTDLNYGEINIQNASPPTISLNFKNVGTSPSSLNSLILGTSDYKISLNRCLGVLPFKSCSVSLSPVKQISIGQKTFSFSGVSISMNIVRKDSNGNPISSTSSANLIFIPSSIPDVEFLGEERVKNINISIKNIGTSVAIPNLIEWTSLFPEANFLINRCSSISLRPNTSCSITVSIKKPEASFSKQLQVSYSGIDSPKSLNFVIKNNSKIKFYSNSFGTISAVVKDSNPIETVVSDAIVSGEKTVVLTPVPNSGYELSEWLGDCSGQSLSSCEISMSKNRNVGAKFLKSLNRIFDTNGITNPVTLTHWFGDLNVLKFEDYNTKNWTGNITFNPRSTFPSPFSPGVSSENNQPIISFSNYEKISSNCASLNQDDCTSNLKKWLSKLTSITLPDTGNLPILITGNMKINNLPVVSVNSGLGPSRFVLDLFDDNSKFYFDGGGSPLQLNPALFGQIFNSNNLDSVEIRRPDLMNKEYKVSFNQNLDGFYLRSSSGQLLGQFKKVDALRLGRSSPQYLNGNSGTAIYTKPIKFIIEELPTIRTPGKNHSINIEQLTQVVTKVNDAYYSNFLQNQTWGPVNTSGAPVINYNNSSLLRGQYSWIGSWNSNYIGSPVNEPAYIDVNVKSIQQNCSNSESEITVTRGKPGNVQIIDDHCGVRDIRFSTDNSGNSGPVDVLLKINFESTDIRQGMNFSVSTNNTQRLVNKARIYIPPTSKRINLPINPLIPWDGKNKYSSMGTNICNTTLLNYTYDNWITTSCQVSESFSNVVLTKPISNPITQDRNYGGFGKVRIYDSFNNISNWNLTCSYNGLDVDLTLSNVITGQREHFLNFNLRDPYGKGYCHQVLINNSIAGENFPTQDPYIMVIVNLNDVIGQSTPVNGVISGTYSQFLIDYVDTDVNSETPESYLGISP